MEHFNGNPDSHNSSLVPSSPTRAVVVQRPEVSGAYDVYDPEGSSGSGSAFEYVRLLLRHKGKLCLFGLGGIVLGILAGVPFKPIYKAQTDLEVVSLNKDFMDMKQSSPVGTSDESFETSEEETQVKLLQSESLLDRVINKFDPGLVYIRHTPRLAESGWRAPLHLPPHLELTDRQQLLTDLANSLKVKSTPKTRVIEVSVYSTDAKLTTDFAN